VTQWVTSHGAAATPITICVLCSFRVWHAGRRSLIWFIVLEYLASQVQLPRQPQLVTAPVQQSFKTTHGDIDDRPPTTSQYSVVPVPQISGCLTRPPHAANPGNVFLLLKLLIGEYIAMKQWITVLIFLQSSVSFSIKMCLKTFSSNFLNLVTDFFPSVAQNLIKWSHRFWKFRD